jgi:hypothetical protein
MGAKGRAVIHEHLRKELAELIVDDVRRDLQSRRKTGQAPPDLLVQYIPSTFILVLNWWAQRVEARFLLTTSTTCFGL